MKRIQPCDWGSLLLLPHSHRVTRQFLSSPRCLRHSALRNIRMQSTSAPLETFDDANSSIQKTDSSPIRQRNSSNQPYPSSTQAGKSAKLAALHARLSLSPKFPLLTLSRSLVDPTANPNTSSNNSSFAILGSDLMGYWTAEHVICNYPRLPMPIVFAAQDAYVGTKALSTMAGEWGVEHTPYPGREVDPGFLQYRAITPDNSLPGTAIHQTDEGEVISWKRGINWRVVKDDEFGEMDGVTNGWKRNTPGQSGDNDKMVTTLENARRNFVRAVIGAIYLHAGTASSYAFFKSHVLSRHLPLHKLFDFPVPTRDLSRLCAREGFEPPVSRLISETGRLSRHPVFVVGVFSGKDKLGEAAGGSLDEARVRAAAAALRSWYLYSPMEVTVPSSAEKDRGTSTKWKPNMVDCGEVMH